MHGIMEVSHYRSHLLQILIPYCQKMFQAETSDDGSDSEKAQLLQLANGSAKKSGHQGGGKKGNYPAQFFLFFFLCTKYQKG
jgi:hypothetical protein